MKQSLIFCISFACLSLLQPMAEAAMPSLLIPTPPQVHAKSYIMIDAKSGKVLAEKNKDMQRPPASLTKLMSLYVIGNALSHQQISLEDKVTISKHAWKQEGSRMFVRVGSHVPVSDLIKGMIVASGNDATMAMAEYVGGNVESFVGLMNQAAGDLNMTNSHFQNPTGLPRPGHFTTASDLSKLAKSYIDAFPDHYSWYKQKWLTYNKIRQPNRNRLLWRDNRIDGMKTGHTDSAGFCLIASGIDHDTRLITVLMGATSDEDRASQTESLMNYGFRYFQTKLIQKANHPITSIRIWEGKEDKVSLGVASDAYITIPKGERTPPTITPILDHNLIAPIAKGQTCGTLEVRNVNQDLIASFPLVAIQSIKHGSLWQMWMDRIIRKVSHG